LIDIHSHILWGFDDGSRSVDESAAMVRLAAESGTTDIVATPHANLEYVFQPQLIQERILQLGRIVGPILSIHSGCDFHFYPDHIDLAVQHPSRFTINGKGYLLIEFSDLIIFKETAAMIARLRTAGITSILTHPERNYLLHRRIEDLSAWVKDGLLLQVTAQSLFGRFGADVRKFSEELLARGLVHIIASDAHDCEDRPPRLDLARNHVQKKYGGALAAHLFVRNPSAVLNGFPVPAMPPPEPRKWYHFGRRL
jgi:protein-tyrosine phosphatase